MLNEELGHGRMEDSMALVQAIASQTLRGAGRSRRGAGIEPAHRQRSAGPTTFCCSKAGRRQSSPTSCWAPSRPHRSGARQLWGPRGQPRTEGCAFAFLAAAPRTRHQRRQVPVRFSVPDGVIPVNWRREDGALVLDWAMNWARRPQPPERSVTSAPALLISAWSEPALCGRLLHTSDFSVEFRAPLHLIEHQIGQSHG